jgi:hypothetical protein
MRRTLTKVAAATALAVGASLAAAAPAAADPVEKNEKSVHAFFCPGLGEHRGEHSGWFKPAKNERRNVGGTCPAP